MFKRFRKLISFSSPFPVLTLRPRHACTPSHRSVYLHCQHVMSFLPEVFLSLSHLGFDAAACCVAPRSQQGQIRGWEGGSSAPRAVTCSCLWMLSSAFLLLRCYRSCGVPRYMAKQYRVFKQWEGCGWTESERLILFDQCVLSILNCCLAFPPTPQLFQHSTIWSHTFLYCFSLWWFR